MHSFFCALVHHSASIDAQERLLEKVSADERAAFCAAEHPTPSAAPHTSSLAIEESLSEIAQSVLARARRVMSDNDSNSEMPASAIADLGAEPFGLSCLGNTMTTISKGTLSSTLQAHMWDSQLEGSSLAFSATRGSLADLSSTISESPTHGNDALSGSRSGAVPPKRERSRFPDSETARIARIMGITT
jgi:hypothetical protein